MWGYRTAIVRVGQVVLATLSAGCVSERQEALSPAIITAADARQTRDVRNASQFRLTPLAAAEQQVAAGTIRKLLARHPAIHDVLSDAGVNIALFRDIWTSDLRAGGLYTGPLICIAMNSAAGHRSPMELARILVHEASSIVFDKWVQRETLQRWLGCNAPSFAYIGDPITAARAGFWRTDRSDEACRDGILADYGRASPEEDFNLFSEYLLLEYGSLCRAADTHPRVRCKVDVAMEIWKCAAPNIRFNEAPTDYDLLKYP